MLDPRIYPTPRGSTVLDTDFVKFFKRRLVSINLASIATIVGAEQDVTISGLESDEIVMYFAPDEALGVAVGGFTARVKSANTLAILLVNPTAGALDAGAKNFSLITCKVGTL